MSLKTAYCYNEDNFIEQNESMNELTVTITLNEYRNLIEDKVYSEKAIEKLQEENETLRKANKNLSHLVISKNPELLKNVVTTVKDIFGNKEIVEAAEREDGDSE